MPLTGTFDRILDEKHRLAVPKRLREQFGEQELNWLYIAPGTESSLALYSPSAFEALAARMAERSSNRAEVRNYLRLFYARAERVPLDKQGRICIPDRLVEFAQLKNEVLLLGVHDHAELWDKGQWEAFVARTGPQFDDMAASAFE